MGEEKQIVVIHYNGVTHTMDSGLCERVGSIILAQFVNLHISVSGLGLCPCFLRVLFLLLNKYIYTEMKIKRH